MGGKGGSWGSGGGNGERVVNTGLNYTKSS